MIVEGRTIGALVVQSYDADERYTTEDLELLTVTDSVDETVSRVVECYDLRCAQMPAEPEKADAQ